LWFPAPSAENAKLAEQLLLDAAQNGTLDLPAIAHAPFETGIIRRLCRTRITPMQITLFTAAVSSVVTVLFASGYLLAGTWLALIVGVLDGLDGKQARVKVETTELGKREHVLDYILELSWWLALAYHFASSGALPNAYVLALLLVGSDLVDRYAKRIAKQHTGRNLDDVAPIDRFVRLIGGRRNIYIWMFAIGLALGSADKAFAFFCYWGAGTAAVHMVRAFSIARQRSCRLTPSRGGAALGPASHAPRSRGRPPSPDYPRAATC
jgi:phosphatidylglycerophosphate synthase